MQEIVKPEPFKPLTEVLRNEDNYSEYNIVVVDQSIDCMAMLNSLVV